MKLVARTVNYFLCGKLKQISRFSIVGAVNTFVDFTVFTVFQSLLGINYTESQAFGYSFGMANSFIFNKKWTFKDNNSSKKTLHELIQFVVANIFSLVVTLISINLLVKHFYVNVYVSKIIVTIIAQITNFFAYRLWVFN